MEPLSKKHEALPDGDDAGGDIDRLSKLPDEILHYILSISGLQIFDVVKLGMLSKRWNRLWLTMPYLDIDLYPNYPPRIKGVLYRHTQTSYEKIRSFINWVLTRQGVFRLIRFRMCSHSSFDNVQILRWLRVVAERNIQELDIDFVPSLVFFRLPLFIAVNDSLRVLKLTPGKKVMRLPSVVRLDQLRSLHLTDVKFTDTALLQRLFSGCCSLESLRFDKCQLPNFGFVGFSSPHLKELFISFTFECDEDSEFKFDIKISCPNLISFDFIAPVAMNLILEDVSSLETACLELLCLPNLQEQPAPMMHRILKELHNVKDLKLLGGSQILDMLCYTIDELKCCPPSLPKVKSLSLCISISNAEMEVIFLLLDHCPNLEVLTLENDNAYFGEFDDEHWELQCEGTVSWISHTHLKAIIFDSFAGKDYELIFLRFLLKNAKSLEKLDVIWMSKSAISSEKIQKVLMFPKASSQIVVTFLD